MYAIWQAIIGFLGGPVIKGLIDAYNLHLKATTTDKQTASNLAGQEIAAQTAETQAITSLKIAQIGHPWEVEKLFAYVTLFYYAKLLIWDKVLGLGSTDPLTGWVLWAANLVIGFYFTKRTAENVTTIIKAFR
jgi:hypothetical protein